MCRLVLIDETKSDFELETSYDRSLSLMQIVDTAITADIVDKVFAIKGYTKGHDDVNEPGRTSVTKHLSISTRQLVVQDDQKATVLYIFDLTPHLLKV